MYIIIGIDHPRIVGISDKDGKAYAFNPQNKNGYREPKNAEEEAQMLLCGKEYYDVCETKNMPFGIIEIAGQTLNALSEHPELYSVIANSCVIDGLEKSKIFIRKCRYCGNLFRPQSPRQQVCKRKKCQSKRNLEKTMKSRKRKENKQN